jgi:palmitoyl-protein thioesterase
MQRWDHAMPHFLRFWAIASIFVVCAHARKHFHQTKYVPVVLMHGLFMTHVHMQHIERRLKRAYPGIIVVNLQIHDDHFGSFFTPMNVQLERVARAIQSDSRLQDGFDFYGESLGGLLARAYVNKYNTPRVHNLISMNAPQAGIGSNPIPRNPIYSQGYTLVFPLLAIYGFIETIFPRLAHWLFVYDWPNCSWCGFWKDNRHGIDSYREQNTWLAGISNELEKEKNKELYRANMLSLNKYMCIRATKDWVISPSFSAHHRFWKWEDAGRTDKTIPYLNETQGYKEDVLGLRSLDERGALILAEFNGNHQAYSYGWWDKHVMLPMLGNQL